MVLEEDPRKGAVDALRFAPPQERPQLRKVVGDVPVLEPIRPNPFADPPVVAAVAEKPVEAKLAKVEVTPKGEPVDLTAEDDIDGEFDNLNLDVTAIDDVLDPGGPAVEEKPADIAKSAGTHACGLPTVLMDKERACQYLRDHKVNKEHRDAMEYTVIEQRLYEIYSQAKRTQRLAKQHFVASLRMYRSGYPLDITRELDLNKMKVGE